MSTNNPWYPSIDQYVHPQVSYAIKYLYDKVYSAQTGVDVLSQATHTLTAPGQPSTWLHPEDKNAIKSALQASGSHPLNVSNLLGVLSQPQQAMVNITAGTSTTQIVTTGTPTNGQLQLQGGVLFYYTAATDTWTAIAATGVILEDTHSNRVANFSPASYPNGTAFFETDRHAMYINIASANWVLMESLDIDLFVNRPSDLGTNDTNFLFLASDTLLFYYWDGSAWHTISVNTVSAGTYGDGTHVAQPVVDANGRITAINSVLITGAAPTGTAGGVLAGSYPNPSLAPYGVGAGTYTVGDRKTPVTGNLGTITVDAYGRITAIQQAT